VKITSIIDPTSVLGGASTAAAGSISTEAAIVPNTYNVYSFGVPVDGPLPVNLVSFKGIAEGKTARLEWTTTSEVNSERFDIERSDNGKNWEYLGSVKTQGEKTKIYFVEMFGYDTHASQVNPNDASGGVHANLLKKLSDSISAFQNDLKLQGTEDKVIGMTFSDFGRRASSNASFGTDHGVAAPMFVFGTGIKRQVVGTNPDLVNDLVPLQPTAGDKNQDIKMQIDFRRIYSDILNDWFGTSGTTTNSLLFKNFKTTSLFSTVIETVSSGAWPDRSIWSAGRMPGPADYVKINPGHTIAIGQNISVRNIQVEGGGEIMLLGDFTINTTG
jgi:hypothetical protein